LAADCCPKNLAIASKTFFCQTQGLGCSPLSPPPGSYNYDETKYDIWRGEGSFSSPNVIFCCKALEGFAAYTYYLKHQCKK